MKLLNASTQRVLLRVATAPSTKFILAKLNDPRFKCRGNSIKERLGKLKINKMDEVEAQVQKKLVTFCKYLKEHVEKWKSALQESGKTVEALCNQAEQLRHVEKVNLRDMEGFEETQNALKSSILNGIEEEISIIKEIIEKLNKTNQDLNNKLTTFEKATMDLDWERNSVLLKGSPTQPHLSRILTDGLEFWLYFKSAFQNINENFKLLDLRNETAMGNFEKAFKVDLQNKTVTDLLALTQYVDNAPK